MHLVVFNPAGAGPDCRNGHPRRVAEGDGAERSITRQRSGGRGAGADYFTAGPASSLYASLALQYRFQVFNDAGTLALDSGPLSTPRYTATVTLTPLVRYTWRVRAEFQGTPGPWSSTASFRTPSQPPAYNRPIGDWQRCAGLSTTALVECVWDKVKPTDSVRTWK